MRLPFVLHCQDTVVSLWLGSFAREQGIFHVCLTFWQLVHSSVNREVLTLVQTIFKGFSCKS